MCIAKKRNADFLMQLCFESINNVNTFVFPLLRCITNPIIGSFRLDYEYDIEYEYEF